MSVLDSPKILYLILASSNSEHERDALTQSQTWASQVQENVFWLRGSDLPSFKLVGRELFVPTVEGYKNILRKTLQGLSWINKNFEYDFVFRTNVSTYVDVKRLGQFIKEKRMSLNSAAGYPEYLKKSEPAEKGHIEAFLSGSGILLGRDVSFEMTKSDCLFSDSSPDDVAISRFLRDSGVKTFFLPRSNIHSIHIYTPAPFIRCKSSTNEFAASIRMKLVHEIVTSNYRTKVIAYFDLLSFEIQLLTKDLKCLPDEIIRFMVQIKRNLRSRKRYLL